MFCCFDFFGDPLGLCFGQRLEFLVEAAHAGDAGTTVADVVDYFVVARRILQGAPWGSAYQVLGWIILNIGNHLKFDYPDPWVRFPVVGTVDAHPKVTEVNAIFPAWKNSSRRRLDAFRL